MTGSTCMGMTASLGSLGMNGVLTAMFYTLDTFRSSGAKST